MKNILKKSLLSTLVLSCILTLGNTGLVKANKSYNSNIVDTPEITPFYAWDWMHGYQVMGAISTYAAWTDSTYYKFKVASERNGSGSDIVFSGRISSSNYHLVHRLKEKIKTIGDKEQQFVAACASLGISVVTAGGVGPLAILAMGSNSWTIKNLFNEINALYSDVYDLQQELR